MKFRNLKFCSNCNKEVNIADKFCRYCGVSVTEANYRPSFENVARIYGPPPRKATHLCEVCGYSWTTFQMRDRERYCPLCGGNAPQQQK